MRVLTIDLLEWMWTLKNCVERQMKPSLTREFNAEVIVKPCTNRGNKKQTCSGDFCEIKYFFSAFQLLTYWSITPYISGLNI